MLRSLVCFMRFQRVVWPRVVEEARGRPAEACAVVAERSRGLRSNAKSLPPQLAQSIASGIPFGNQFRKFDISASDCQDTRLDFSESGREG